MCVIKEEFHLTEGSLYKNWISHSRIFINEQSWADSLSHKDVSQNGPLAGQPKYLDNRTDDQSTTDNYQIFISQGCKQLLRDNDDKC